MNAFKYLGGVPAELLYGNMHHVFMGRQNGRKIINVELLHFANHCMFRPILCPPYSPWIKGKVERPIDYIRQTFWRGYLFKDLLSANHDLLHWLSHSANCRIHGTHRQPGDMRWQQEAKRLNPIPADYDTSIKVYRTVYKDCMISYNTNHTMNIYNRLIEFGNSSLVSAACSAYNPRHRKTQKKAATRKVTFRP